MIGPKKLSVIRKDLTRAFLATGEDPIRWLEERMTSTDCPEKATDANEVLQSLQRVLAAPKTSKRRKQQARTKQ